MLVDHKVKEFTELLPCTFAMYDCRQLEDVSGVESVSSFYQVLPPHLPSFCSVVPQAFGALELKGPLYMTSYIRLTWIAFFQYFHVPNFTSNISMDSALINRLSLYNSIATMGSLL